MFGSFTHKIPTAKALLITEYHLMDAVFLEYKQHKRDVYDDNFGSFFVGFVAIAGCVVVVSVPFIVFKRFVGCVAVIRCCFVLCCFVLFHFACSFFFVAIPQTNKC